MKTATLEALTFLTAFNLRERHTLTYHHFLCGECATCEAAGCVETRVNEYLVNLDDGEVPSMQGAFEWLAYAYPACSIGGTIIAIIRELFVAAAFAAHPYVLYTLPQRRERAELWVACPYEEVAAAVPSCVCCGMRGHDANDHDCSTEEVYEP